MRLFERADEIGALQLAELAGGIKAGVPGDLVNPLAYAYLVR